jgi:hypothetical protein
MRAVLQAAIGKAEEKPIVELSATTTTPPIAAWVPIRAAKDPRDTPSNGVRGSVPRAGPYRGSRGRPPGWHRTIGTQIQLGIR